MVGAGLEWKVYVRVVLHVYFSRISKEVYKEIQNENLFTISSEPTNVQGYINEVLGEVWHIDPVLLQKARDKLPSED